MFIILFNPGNPPGRIVSFFNANIRINLIISILLSIIFPKTQKINSRKIRETGPGAAPIIINALSLDSFPTHVGINNFLKLKYAPSIHQEAIMISPGNPQSTQLRRTQE